MISIKSCPEESEIFRLAGDFDIMFKNAALE
jgi:hypothetical protein